MTYCKNKGTRDEQFEYCLFPEYMCESYTRKNKSKDYPDPFHLSRLNGINISAPYDMPNVGGYYGRIPNSLSSFIETRSLTNRGLLCQSYTHFFIEDSHFMCLSNEPDKYVDMFLSCGGLIGPDYSVKIGMPYSIKLNNIFTNKVLTCFYQNKGIPVIPNIVWAEPRIYDVCFSGFPSHSIVAVNSMGIIGDRDAVYFWRKGYDEMLVRLEPLHIIRYGDKIYGELESISTYYPNNHINRMRYGR